MIPQPHHESFAEISFKAIVGICTPLVAALTSFQENIEWGLRITSLIVGVLVGVATLISMIRKLKK